MILHYRNITYMYGHSTWNASPPTPVFKTLVIVGIFVPLADYSFSKASGLGFMIRLLKRQVGVEGVGWCALPKVRIFSP